MLPPFHFDFLKLSSRPITNLPSAKPFLIFLAEAAGSCDPRSHTLRLAAATHAGLAPPSSASGGLSRL